MYTIYFSKFKKQWLVLSPIDGVAHSAWKSLVDAKHTAYKLNALTNRNKRSNAKLRLVKV